MRYSPREVLGFSEPNVSAVGLSEAPDITVADTIPWELGSDMCLSGQEAIAIAVNGLATKRRIGSISPEDCIQQGRRIAVTRLPVPMKWYAHRLCKVLQGYPPRPCSGYDPTVDTGYSRVSAKSSVLEGSVRGMEVLGGSWVIPKRNYLGAYGLWILCGITEDLEIYAADETGLLKKSFIFGQPVEDFPDSKLVNFFGYDPDVDGDLDLKPWVERPFTSFNMKPLDIVILDFAFDRREAKQNRNLTFTWEPRRFRGSINTDLHVPTQMKILALSELLGT
ncbi:hypothetical protein AK812_SmicGene1683 [Symbiodinium microadriaticum]|uniref:Uncharacterized protein n=1 Tax=Symbiodinium microadriaticum TaxID=2951 RepID=A0A1Q9F3D3_SYMMI|nr:hypothetical protein AK812_SmicGene1683 [Symbiodinium microadriaticum]